MSQHGKACELLLMHARADYDKNLIPGYRDLSKLLTFPGEFAGSPAQAVNKIKDIIPMSREEQTNLRKNRGQFTTSEDNLLLRGVVSEKIASHEFITCNCYDYDIHMLCLLLLESVW